MISHILKVVCRLCYTEDLWYSFVTLLPVCGSVTLLRSPQCGAALSSLPPALCLPACIIKLTNAVCGREHRHKQTPSTSLMQFVFFYGPFCSLNTLVAERSSVVIIKRRASGPRCCLCCNFLHCCSFSECEVH